MTLQQLILTIPGYVDKTDPADSAVLAWLKESVNVQIEVPHSKLLQWAANGRRKKLEDGVNTTEPIGSMCSTAVGMLNDGQSIFDTNDAGNVAMLDALVTAGILSTADKTALMDIGKITLLRHATIGLSKVHLYQVTEARL